MHGLIQMLPRECGTLSPPCFTEVTGELSCHDTNTMKYYNIFFQNKLNTVPDR